MMLCVRSSRSLVRCSRHVTSRGPQQQQQARTFVNFRRRETLHEKVYGSNIPPKGNRGLSWTSSDSDHRYVPGPEGIPSRREQIERLQEGEEYDVLVVGGGATGAGIALDAAARGLEVACIERGDFACETSSRSTKLIWAGIRYIGTATSALLSTNLLFHPIDTIKSFMTEMHMVYHCHKERHFMTTTQQHLCNWIPIVVPFDSWYVTPPPMKHPLFSFFPVVAPLVFKFYDSLSSFTCPSSYILTKKRAQEVFPQLDASKLKYCSVFYEAQHNDARTNLAIAMTAAEKGAAIVNYVEAVELLYNKEGRAIGAKVMDHISRRTWNVYAKHIVLAGGPFTDELREMEGKNQPPAVRGAAGTHVVLPGYYMPRNLGLLDFNTSDGRFLFVLPWQGHTLVGTTDRKSPAERLPEPPEYEIDWILKECSKYLSPDLKVRRSDVLSAWTGWRPLAVDPHAPPGAPASRDHVISENPKTGVFFIAGGKWTTYRQMAEELVDRIVGPDGPRSKTLDIKLHGGEGYSDHLSFQLIQKYGMSQEVAEHLVDTYGARAWEVCEFTKPTGKSWPRFGNPIIEGFPYVEAEVVYACREYACTIEDVLSRRTRLAFLNKEAAVEAIPMVADIMAEELGWSRKAKESHMRSARLYVESYGGKISMKADALLREASRESPDKLFDALDRDGNGYIDEQEVAEAVSILGLKMSANEVKKAFKQMDKSGNGRVTVDAFKSWWVERSASPLHKRLMRELHRQTFGSGNQRESSA